MIKLLIHWEEDFLHETVHKIYTAEVHLLTTSTIARLESREPSPRCWGPSRSTDPNGLYVARLPTRVPVPLHFVVGRTYAVRVPRTHFPDSLSNFESFGLCFDRYFRSIHILLYVIPKLVGLCVGICIGPCRFLRRAWGRPFSFSFHSRTKNGKLFSNPRKLRAALFRSSAWCDKEKNMRLCSIQIMRVHILLVLSYIFLSFLEMLLEFLFLSRRGGRLKEFTSSY